MSSLLKKIISLYKQFTCLHPPHRIKDLNYYCVGCEDCGAWWSKLDKEWEDTDE